MRRKAGTLIPLELEILEAGLDLRRRGRDEFHGFAVAKHIQELEGARRLTSHGTLYKALARMEKAGLLESRWEDPETAANEQRPRRRFYAVTGVGERALSANRVKRGTSAARRPGLEQA